MSKFKVSALCCLCCKAIYMCVCVWGGGGGGFNVMPQVTWSWGGRTFCTCFIFLRGPELTTFIKFWFSSSEYSQRTQNKNVHIMHGSVCVCLTELVTLEKWSDHYNPKLGWRSRTAIDLATDFAHLCVNFTLILFVFLLPFVLFSMHIFTPFFSSLWQNFLIDVATVFVATNICLHCNKHLSCVEKSNKCIFVSQHKLMWFAQFPSDRGRFFWGPFTHSDYTMK